MVQQQPSDLHSSAVYNKEAATEASLEAIVEDKPIDSFPQLPAARQEAAADEAGSHPSSTASSSHGSYEAHDETSFPRGNSAQSLHTWTKHRDRGVIKETSSAANSDSSEIDPHPAHSSGADLAEEESTFLLRDTRAKGESISGEQGQRMDEHRDSWDEEAEPVSQGAAGKAATPGQPWYRDREASLPAAGW